ncbi:MAG: hypothetical protein IJZ30_05575 [Alphaproteobacteria bacterium]|nr:hypothetical protein [Alphaproteobacteria bacterium]
MSGEKKQNVRMIFKVGAFLAFIMLGYLGIRSYKRSVEKLKINKCTEEIISLVKNIQEAYFSSTDYGEFDYKTAERMKLFPSNMKREGFREVTNAYMGGVDVYYSSLTPDRNRSAFEVSFQGLSQMGCMALLRLDLSNLNAIAVAGFATPTPSGVLDEIYVDTKPEEIKDRGRKFIARGIMYLSDEKAENACACKSKDECSVIWKFK